MNSQFKETLFKSLLKIAEENSDLKVTFKETLKGAATGTAITATAMIVGGASFGPVGLAVGGAIGGAVGGGVAYATSKPYKPILQVLRDMDEGQRKKLADAAISEAKKLGIDLLSKALDCLSSAVSRTILTEAMRLLDYNVSQ